MLATRNIIKDIRKDGTVVIIIKRICEKSDVPADDDASTVVSESGDTLSPKYAPEMIAPAVQPGSYPCAVPMPISATPMVAMVVQELPVITAMTALMIHEAKRNIPGRITFIP